MSLGPGVGLYRVMIGTVGVDEFGLKTKTAPELAATISSLGEPTARKLSHNATAEPKLSWAAGVRLTRSMIAVVGVGESRSNKVADPEPDAPTALANDPIKR